MLLLNSLLSAGVSVRNFSSVEFYFAQCITTVKTLTRLSQKITLSGIKEP